MRKITKALILAGLLAPLASCGNNAPAASSSSVAPKRNKVSSESLYVQKVDNLSDDFILGMDSSSVISLENAGVKYYDFDGQEKDLFEILAANGVNYIRVRVWNDPFDEDNNGYGGGNCDINVAKAIGLRANQYGMKLHVDFHYSDFWADPAKYQAPKAWANMDADGKATACYEYTKQSLQFLKDANIDVGLVQVGNETNNGVAGETTHMNRCKILGKGAEAVREVYPDALVAVHFANPEKTDNFLKYAEKLDYYKSILDYDVFGISYYPYWHGTLDNLTNVMNTITTKYGKKTMIMETSYANTLEDTDFSGNSIGEGATGDYPFTLNGQANHIRTLTDTVVNKTQNCIGICYWEGTWIACGTNSWEENVEKWKEYGCGWSSEYSATYENEDAGVNGGSAVDNQCFFDKNGHVLESIKVFGMMYDGNTVELKPDGVKNPEETVYTYDSEYKLPETVDLIYNDNSRAARPVTWEAFDLEAARAAGNADYQIKGVSEGYDVTLLLHVLEYNYLSNYSFEEATIAPWALAVRNEGSLSDNYIVKPTNENPKSGSYAFHFWAKAANTAGFDLTQEVALEDTGTYKFTFSIMGGNGGGTIDETAQDIYGFVKIDGVEVAKVDAKLKGYSKTYEGGTYTINDIAYTAGSKMEVGVHVEANEAGSWGDIDDCMVNIVL
ncbi:MAG: glycosyl hydrolase 53 family protein [Bacilli bacterium]|nr:glycosyl hydrolase 53 family protein [Bacilli bacterium]